MKVCVYVVCTYSNILEGPNLTENDRILFTTSPLVSGTSFINAMTRPNNAKNEVNSSPSGYSFSDCASDKALCTKK